MVAFSRRYGRGAILLTSNRSVGEWGAVFGDPVVATEGGSAALLDSAGPRTLPGGGTGFAEALREAR
jgi:IstB-like ATP binding protein